MTDKFPLCQLPYVALYEVLNHVEPKATLPLSLCSNRSKRLVKDCQGPRKEIDIIFDIPENVLTVNNAPAITVVAVSKLPADLETVNIGFHMVPVEMEEDILKTYWMNEKEGLKEVINLTSDVFNRDLFSLEFRGSVSSDDARYWLEWIPTRQDTLPRLYLSNEVDNHLLMYVLENGIVTGDLILDSECSLGFRGPSPRLYPLDWLYLEQAHRITFKYFLAIDVKRLSLLRSSLTSQEVNIFLKKWINGEGSKRIMELFVWMEEEVNYDVLMEGIEVNKRDPNLRRDYVVCPNVVERIEGGLDIKRKEDGAMATIINQHRLMFSSVTVFFWPDYNGNPYH